MSILLNNQFDQNSGWREALRKELPELTITCYPDVTDVSAIHYGVVWGHPFGDLKRYPNLRAIFSLGAGMEHLLNDPELPDVPLISLGDPAMSQDMANYALYWVIDYHRHMQHYRGEQTRQLWDRLETAPTNDFNVLVLGLGRIGQHVAELIQQAGFNVTGWDFKQKSSDTVATAAGLDAFSELLPTTHVVISCLALNERSHHLINADFLAQLPMRSHVVNISRGGVIDEDALLDALDSDHLNGAALDVFSIEPLPSEHRLWTHPKVNVTPHMAGPTHISSAASVIAGNIRRMELGEQPEPLFDRSRGVQAATMQEKNT
jgi:glyoxylate/hydroxypyruvate reductase A